GYHFDYMEYIQVNKNIHLEAIRYHVAPVVFKAINYDRQFLRKWLPFVDSTKSVSDTQLFIESLTSPETGRRDPVYTTWYNYEFAGLIGFKDSDWINHKTELGYWLIEKMQGK